VGGKGGAPTREGQIGRSGEGRDGWETVADVQQALKDGSSKGLPSGLTIFVGSGQSGIHTCGSEDVIGSLVGNVITKHQGRINPVLDARKALVCLDLPERASRQAGDFGFEVRPKDVPLALTGYDSALLEVMNASQSSG
jgi:hypothetical protein